MGRWVGNWVGFRSPAPLPYGGIVMNIDKIKKRTKRFLKQRPKWDKQAKKALAKFPRWDDDTAQHLAVETLILLYDTYRNQYKRGVLYKMTVLEAYLESIKTYAQRWMDWRITTDKGGDEENVTDETAPVATGTGNTLGADFERGN